MLRLCELNCCKDYVCDCCLSEDDIKKRLIKREIEQTFVQNIYKKKVILLGNAEAGKSTFLKQMKLIHGHGFSVDDRIRLIPLIHEQIVTIIRRIYRAMQNLSISFEKSQNDERASLLITANINDTSITKLSSQMADAIKHIWSDAGVQLCYCRRNEYRLMDSAKYFLDNIDRITDTTYLPTDDDILRVRIPTAGIVQEDFQLSNGYLQIVDVGGQRNERRKWIHCFDNVTAVIFFASLIEYDQISEDSSEQNLMEESLALLRVILSSNYFRNASIIIFLNKTDLLQERITSKPIRNTFPDFDGKDNDVEAAKQYIKNKYCSLLSNQEYLENFTTQFTCSIDRKNIELVIEEIKEEIFWGILNQCTIT